MIIEDIPFFAEFVATTILLTFGYAFAKLWFNHSKDKSKARRKDQQKAEKDSGMEEQIDGYLDNIGTIGNKIENEINFIKEKGGTPEQLKSLESNLALARNVQKFEPIIRIAKKPLLKVIARFMDRV